MNATSEKTIFFEKVSRLVILALAFLVPIFFLPTTTEFFQFNKLALLSISTILLLVIWAFRIIAGQKMELTKSVIDLPLIAFTIVVILSTIFSQYKSASVFGSQGRWFPSLFGVLSLVTFYYVITPLIKDKNFIKNVLLALVASFTISTFVSILSYYGVYLGADTYWRIPNFTLTGSVTTTLFLAGLAIIMAILLGSYEDNLVKKVIFNVTVIVNFFYIAIVNSFAGWSTLLVGIVAILFFFDIAKLFRDKTTTLILGGALTVIVLINLLPSTKSVIRNSNYPVEITMPVRESWLVSSSVVQEFPLLATGPATFQMNFTRFRPLSLNNTPLSNVRFDKPYNELFNVMASLGLVGTTIAIYFWLRVFRLAANNAKYTKDETGLGNVLSVTLVVILTSYLFTYATVLNTFLLFLVLSLLVANHLLSETYNKLSENVVVSFTSVSAVTSIGTSGVIKNEFMHFIVATPLLLISAYAGYLLFRSYAAEYYMRESILAALKNDGSRTYDMQGKAINMFPQRDTYHTAYAQTNLALANALASKQELTNEERSTIQTLIAQAIRSARVASEVVNPLNVANWETRAVIYRSLLGVAQNAGEWTISSYNTAIQLDSTNPALRLDLGGVYYAQEDYLSAANYFRQATALKPDYANAHYNFAQALIKLNDVQNGIRELEVVKKLVPEGSDDFNKVTDEIATLSALPNVAGAATDKPTVEEIAGPEQAGPVTNQQPLTNPEETGAVGNQNIDVNALPPRETGTTQEQREQNTQQNTQPSGTAPNNQ